MSNQMQPGDTTDSPPRTARRLLIDLALARARPGTGSSDTFMTRRTAVQQFPDLRETLKGLDWLVAGAVAKLAAGRVRDIGDVATMLGWAADDALEDVRLAVERFSPADRGDLESLIYLGRRERGVGSDT